MIDYFKAFFFIKKSVSFQNVGNDNSQCILFFNYLGIAMENKVEFFSVVFILIMNAELCFS